jgi:hypothetical protein
LQYFATVEVFTAMPRPFCVVTSCNVAVGYKRFGGPFCLHLQGDTWSSKRWYPTTTLHCVSGLTQPPIQWVPAALSLGVKRPVRKADHSPPSSTEVEECVELYLHSPSTPSWRGVQLKRKDNFTFTLHCVTAQNSAICITLLCSFC